MNEAFLVWSLKVATELGLNEIIKRRNWVQTMCYFIVSFYTAPFIDPWPFMSHEFFALFLQVFFSTAVASGSMYIFGQHHSSPKTVKKQVNMTSLLHSREDLLWYFGILVKTIYELEQFLNF